MNLHIRVGKSEMKKTIDTPRDSRSSDLFFIMSSNGGGNRKNFQFSKLFSSCISVASSSFVIYIRSFRVNDDVFRGNFNGLKYKNMICELLCNKIPAGEDNDMSWLTRLGFRSIKISFIIGKAFGGLRKVRMC